MNMEQIKACISHFTSYVANDDILWNYESTLKMILEVRENVQQ